MSQNTTAMTRGGMLAKHQIASQKRQANAAGIVKIDKPNRAQRRAAKAVLAAGGNDHAAQKDRRR